MPQSWDMGQILLLPLRRKASWGFLRPKNPTDSARGQQANHYTTEAVFSVFADTFTGVIRLKTYFKFFFFLKANFERILW